MRATRYRCGVCDQRLCWDAGSWLHCDTADDHPPWPGRWCPDDDRQGGRVMAALAADASNPRQVTAGG